MPTELGLRSDCHSDAQDVLRDHRPLCLLGYVSECLSGDSSPKRAALNAQTALK